MKRISHPLSLRSLSILSLLSLIVLLFSACSGPSSVPSDQPTDTPYRIGVIQLMEHAALSEAYHGFVRALQDQEVYDHVELDVQVGQGDLTSLSTIGDRFLNRGVDLILAIGTDAAQVMAGKTADIPILGTAITSYTVSGLAESDERPGSNISGTCDMNPVTAQIDLLLTLKPDAETIGLLYNSSEDNSLLQIDLAKQYITAQGYQYREAALTSSVDIQQAVQSLAQSCDALYLPTDNMIASAMSSIHDVTVAAGLPNVCGAVSMVSDGGLASMGIDYGELGYMTGLMAIEVMQGAEPAEMPIRYTADSDLVVINGDVADAMGLTIPETYRDSVIRDESRPGR